MELGDEAAEPLLISIYDGEVAAARLEGLNGCGSRGAAGAEQYELRSFYFAAELDLDALSEAVSIGVVTGVSVLLSLEGVDGSDRLGGWVDCRGCGKCYFLVRYGEVQACESFGVEEG